MLKRAPGDLETRFAQTVQVAFPPLRLSIPMIRCLTCRRPVAGWAYLRAALEQTNQIAALPVPTDSAYSKPGQGRPWHNRCSVGTAMAPIRYQAKGSHAGGDQERVKPLKRLALIMR